MQLHSVTIKNFRGYDDPVTIEFDKLTAFVGKNDVGKSSIVDALDLFFNGKEAASGAFEEGDINISNAQARIPAEISVCFSDVPQSLVIDSSNPTNLKSEYLLNKDGFLEVCKKFSIGRSLPQTIIRAYHPTNEECCDLLSKTPAQLRTIVDRKGLDCDKNKNASMRKAIRDSVDDLKLDNVEIDVTKNNTKTILEMLEKYFPVYTLFQADRKNTDGDSEIQDPLKAAVKMILAEEQLEEKLQEIASQVNSKLQEVADRTLEKIQEMSPELAHSLNPEIPDARSLKWADVFKNVSISGDEGIPINKRGSGVKRLILLNFFRAEAERRARESDHKQIIYAIEEPETSQHSDNQKKLIDALMNIAGNQNAQVIITTHSATIVKKLSFADLRLVQIVDGHRTVSKVSSGVLPYASLNEVNYRAFAEISEEYHNELYGYLVERGIFNEFKSGKQCRPYFRKLSSGQSKKEQLILTEYIRHQIHHPENDLNKRYTEEELKESIGEMMEFLRKRNCSNND